MAFLPLVFAAMLSSIVLTCPPTMAPSTGGNKTRKREADLIRVTVVSNQKYDPAMNEAHAQVFRSLVADFMKSKGAHYDKDMLQESVMNVDGYFAIVYTLLGYDCDTVNNFLHDAKSSASFIKDIKVKCGGKPEFNLA